MCAMIYVEDEEVLCDYAMASRTSMAVQSGGKVINTTLDFYSKLYILNGGIASETNVLKNWASMTVFEGGMANITTLSSGCRLYVSGGTVKSTAVLEGGKMFFSSGTANITTISGSVFVLSGATATTNNVCSGGSMTVSSGGTANINAVRAGGYLIVYSGGTALNIDWTPCEGVVEVMQGATAKFTSAFSGIYIGSNNQLLSRTEAVEGKAVNNAEEMILMNGGSAHITMVNIGGSMTVSSGGVANTAAISGGGASATVNDGGTAENVVIDSEGRLIVQGGTASEITVKDHGYMFVSNGGEANSATIDKGGLAYLSGGGVANITTLNGGVLNVSGGGVANDTTVLSGSINITGKGILNSTMVHKAGGVTINEGLAISTTLGGDMILLANSAMASATTILNGGEMVVSYVAIAKDTTVNSGGSMHLVDSTCRMTGQTTILEGGSVTLESGAAVDFDISELAPGAEVRLNALSRIGGWSDAIFTLTISGEQQDGTYALAGEAAGFDKTVTVGPASGDALGTLAVWDFVLDGSTGYTLALSDGTLYTTRKTYQDIVTRAVVSSSTVDVGADDFYQSTVVSKGAPFRVFGTANKTTIVSRGSMLVSNGGMANNTVLNGENARLEVFTDGVANNTTVNQGGELRVSEGGLAHSAAVNYDGWMHVCSGGTASAAVVNDGGRLYVSSGGTTNDAVVNYCASMFVYDGGVANRTAVNPCARLFISSGGTANSAAVVGIANSQAIAVVYEGGEANNTWIGYDGMMDVKNAVANNTTVHGGKMNLSAGATMNSATVEYGLLTIAGGATMNIATVIEGGSISVDGTANSTTIGSRGYMTITSGVANSTTVSSGGSMYVYKDGMANSTTVNAGGSMHLSKGGVGNNATVKAGASMFISAGGKLTGKTMIEDGATVAAENGAIIDFAIAGITPDREARINDLSLVGNWSNADFTLTVSGSESNGTYRLAGGAGGFINTITVKNTSGEDVGTFTIGQTVTVGEVSYALAMSGAGDLSVTVSGSTPAPTPTPSGAAKSDIDGNGISDVMFVWTGKNYQHGYWMNGTSTWQSAGSDHPAEWENLGCYDMTGDGKADSVLVGNVVVNGVKGAYIGYYKDANDADANWENIGYLNNADDIGWKNKVGNLTGNASGANSIVWYAPELYSLGAWTDGTETWVTLSNDFGGNDWSLVGCGDFSGDGKDQVVMAYKGGEQYYAVNLDHSSVELGASDSGWEVRAIGDFSGDGKDDIVAFHAETGIVAKWADGLAANWSQLGQMDAEDWFVVGCGDYNGDAKDDLLVRQYSTGMLGYYSSGDMAQWVELGRGVDMQWTVIA